MNKHDRAVLAVSRTVLHEGARELQIGDRVEARYEIVAKLRDEFPDRDITTREVSK